MAAAIGPAIGFPTWQSLVREQGLSEGQAVETMVALVAYLASPDSGGTASEAE